MTLLVYGAYGYTGELIVEEAQDRGLDPIVAGRNGTKTRGVGITHGLDTRVFSPADAADYLDDVDILLNCAGPFTETYEPLVEACLETETAYLDITGELSVFEAIAELDREAEEAAIPLVPGVGFDVVPTDCLASHLHDRLLSGTELSLGIEATGTLSGGTLASMIEHADSGGKIRHNGKIEDELIGAYSREIDFGNGTHNAVSVPLGDVSTAYYTTGIPDIRGYLSLPRTAQWGLRMSQPLMGVLAGTPLKDGLQQLARSVVSGPSEQTRTSERAYIWGELTDGDSVVVSRLETPEPYAFTVDSATTAAQHLEETDANPTGFQTPASAFGTEFVLGLDGVEGFFDEN